MFIPSQPYQPPQQGNPLSPVLAAMLQRHMMNQQIQQGVNNAMNQQGANQAGLMQTQQRINNMFPVNGGVSNSIGFNPY